MTAEGLAKERGGELATTIEALKLELDQWKLAEAAGRQAEDQIRLVIDTIPTMAWSLRSDGIVDFVNQRWTDYTGVSLDQVAQAPVSLIHPEDHSRVMEKWRVDFAVGEPCEDEMRLRSSNGEYRWFLVRTAPLRDDQGDLVKWYGVSIDIEHRKRAEDRLRRNEEKVKALFELLPVGISVLDRHRNIVDANPALERITRLSREELLNGSYRRRSYLNPDGTPKALEELASLRAINENRPINDVETGILTENGEIIWVQVSAAPLALPEVGAVVITQDITERRRAEEALKTSYGELLAVSAELHSAREEEATRIAREIHDELGQKLTALKIALRRAERRLEDLGGSRAVNMVLDTIVAATELADELIGGVQEIAANLRPAVLDELGLGTALQYEGRRFRERTGVHCQVSGCDVELDLPTEISTALFRIFQECLTNVMRHAYASDVEVRLRLDPGWVVLSVRDNGRGVVPNPTASRAALGVLGMKERAGILGGVVEFESSPDDGTTVTARLPHTLKHARPGSG